MKIILSTEEVKAIKDLQRLLRTTNNNGSLSNIVTVSKNNDDTIVDIEPKFVTDYIELIKNMFPLFNGLFHHVFSVVSAFETLGNAFESKWQNTSTKINTEKKECKYYESVICKKPRF